MFWKASLAVLSIIIMSACSLNQQAASEGVTTLTEVALADVTEEVTEEVIPTNIPATETPIVTSTPLPTDTPIPASVANTSSCMVRADLPAYTVVSGDTLSNIASRTGSTIAQLAQFNCLGDSTLITVGQQLRVANSPTNLSTTNTNTQNTNSQENHTRTDSIQTTGTITMSPVQSIDTGEHKHFTLRSDTTVTITWQNFPTHLNLLQVEFTYVDDRYTVVQTSIGIDSNLADGASISWNVVGDLQGKVYASARIPGQTHESVQSEVVTIESIGHVIGPRGAVSIDPNIQAGTPADWGDYVVEPNTQVTITWSGIEPAEYDQLGRVEFQFVPDTGGIRILGDDTDKSDGISYTFTTPDNMSGRILVGAPFGANSRIYAPEIHVRTPDTEVDPCVFNPFGIGGDIPVYPIPNLNTEPLFSIQMGTTYPILGQGGEWSTAFGGKGIFYHLYFGETSGWVQDARGELLGDCQS